MKLQLDIPFKVGDKAFAVLNNKITVIEIERTELEASIAIGEFKHRIKYYYKCLKEDSFVHSYEKPPFVYNTEVFSTVDALLENLRQEIVIAANTYMW